MFSVLYWHELALRFLHSPNHIAVQPFFGPVPVSSFALTFCTDVDPACVSTRNQVRKKKARVNGVRCWCRKGTRRSMGVQMCRESEWAKNALKLDRGPGGGEGGGGGG